MKSHLLIRHDLLQLYAFNLLNKRSLKLTKMYDINANVMSLFHFVTYSYPECWNIYTPEHKWHNKIVD